MMFTKQAGLKTWSDIWLPVLIFMGAFVIYVLCPVTTSTDSRWTLYLSMSMLHEQDADLDEYAGLMEERDYRVVYLNDHIYSYFPPGVPLAMVPYVWAVDTIYPLRYSTDFATYLLEHFPDETTGKIEKVAASLMAALCAVLMYLVARVALGGHSALLLVFIFTFSTSMLSTASRALWQHGPSALCLTAVLWVTLSQREGPKWMFFAGLLLGFSYVIRPTNSISIVALSLFMLLNRRKTFTSYFLGLSIPLIFLVLHSMQVYGMILPPYYLPQRLGTNSHFLEALAGHLISPNRGLFIASPVLLFVFAGIYLQTKNGKFALCNIDPYLAAILILHWVVISSFEFWHGGWSLGPRFFTDVIPYMTYFLIPVLDHQNLWTSRLWKTVFAFTLLAGLFVHFRYATSAYPMMWNQKPVIIIDSPERIWSWTDLQALRGMCRDKLEGAAPGCWFSGDP